MAQQATNEKLRSLIFIATPWIVIGCIVWASWLDTKSRNQRIEDQAEQIAVQDKQLKARESYMTDSISFDSEVMVAISDSWTRTQHDEYDRNFKDDFHRYMQQFAKQNNLKFLDRRLETGDIKEPAFRGIVPVMPTLESKYQ